jgi:hypothetical protein
MADSMRSLGQNAVRGFVICGSLLLLTCSGPQPGEVQDEASRAGRAAVSFTPADEDYFRDMDVGTGPLSREEVIGRNMWLVWTGGNDRFWDRVIPYTFGSFDLLKTLSSHDRLSFSRDNRWRYLGLVNEPCFEKASGPDPERFGLWLDKRLTGPECPPDPFANEQKYPGVAIDARGKDLPSLSRKLPVGSYYGEPTGVVGLRLFTNPDFDDAAAARWDPVRYYTDPNYYLSKDLVRPYRVGMACGLCHVGPSPIYPPADPEKPEWKNLNSTVGAQYSWFDRIFVWDVPHSRDNYIYQLVKTFRPGTLDTSLVSTDSINNPRTMNAIYSLGPRLAPAMRWGKEKLADGQLNNKQFNEYVESGVLKDPALKAFFQPPDTVLTTHILKDASDSVGVLGALNRVYLNIGLFSEEWLLHFNAFVGAQSITPIEISAAERNSEYWKATEAQTPYMALFLVKAGRPDPLEKAPGGDRYLSPDPAVIDRGKAVFAERCARCHSSKIPRPAAGLDDGVGCAGAGYLECWNKYWTWTKTDDFKQRMRQMVLDRDFLNDNYLSTELRVPVTLLQTNACSPLATNAIAGNIWDNFSSQSYKLLPPVGGIEVFDPFTAEKRTYPMRAGGRGYIRPPSLASLWSTAPFLQNNALGPFTTRVGVEDRMKIFDASIEQLLWPERRETDDLFKNKGMTGQPGTGIIDRTDVPSYLIVAPGYAPDAVRSLSGFLHWLLPWAVTEEGGIKVGPIPQGTPVNLVANLELLPESGNFIQRVEHFWRVLKLFFPARRAFGGASETERKEGLAALQDQMLALSKCPDFVVNKGHYFGTSLFAEEPGLSDGEKRDLIEFLKTL